MIVAAFHEAGHAFGYARQHDATLDSVSINRHGGGGITNGRCRALDLPKITALGPIAEAVWELNTSDPFEGYQFEDVLCGIVMWGGGQEDYPDARPVLEDRAWTDVLRCEVVEHWDGLTRLALALTVRGAVDGAEAKRLLR